VFWACIPFLLLCLLGTLPLQPVLPAVNVARVHEVRHPVEDAYTILIWARVQPSSDDDTNPEDAASLWQWMSFSYVEPIFKSAGDHTLDEVDVWTLSPFFKHKNIFHKCLQYLELYVPASRSTPSNSPRLGTLHTHSYVFLSYLILWI